MRLTYTSIDFLHHGVAMPRVPVLLTDDMITVEGPQRWLFYIALECGRTRSPATWRSYAEALLDWLETCQANAWEWSDIEEGHLRAYRNQMLYHPSTVTRRAFSTRTVNGRLRRLAVFYHWAFRQGLVARVPFDYDTVRGPISADAQLIAALAHKRHLACAGSHPSANTGASRRRFPLRTSAACATVSDHVTR